MHYKPWYFYYILSISESTIDLHSASLRYSEFLTALASKMVYFGLSELSHIRPFIPTAVSNGKCSPRNLRMGVSGSSSLYRREEWCQDRCNIHARLEESLPSAKSKRAFDDKSSFQLAIAIWFCSCGVDALKLRFHVLIGKCDSRVHQCSHYQVRLVFLCCTLKGKNRKNRWLSCSDVYTIVFSKSPNNGAYNWFASGCNILFTITTCKYIWIERIQVTTTFSIPVADCFRATICFPFPDV